ncbi:conserved hypothetical protein [Neospora caninum Liverpool]|uniref:Uncharacterized protein n=1 Tax=Neospora caninum (strain Liverpool) TaxID=572307 RepID=F0VQN8_NEOCL|nr:conserved hypothetical protein [Neospora caninum Liverpool]CBZ56035.1 conserved hypothetical protein [Neospora caninum Liverpool]CEL70782.1 TPA: hypothetical protein BN1204_064610 [Neospora caninum Liverpool]|eukprot:XP_003886061.1 conserved hypothetical protein [Neospora caninum Liverpool]
MANSSSARPRRLPPLPLAPFTERRLRALACAMLDGGSRQQADWEWTRDVVVWLEEEKIRFYPRHKRDAMRTATDKTKWWSLMLQYCRDLEMPLEAEGSVAPPCTSETLAGLLDVLSSVAIADIYQDSLEASELSLDSSTLKARQEEASPASSAEAADAEHARAETVEEDLRKILQPLNGVLTHLRVPLLRENATKEEIVSALKAVAVRQTASPPGHEDSLMKHLAVACPLPVDHPAFFKAFVCGLRALHVEHLRETQAEMNQLIEALQALTANPVTDHRLGRVGV